MQKVKDYKSLYPQLLFTILTDIEASFKNQHPTSVVLDVLIDKLFGAILRVGFPYSLSFDTILETSPLIIKDSLTRIFPDVPIRLVEVARTVIIVHNAFVIDVSAVSIDSITYLKEYLKFIECEDLIDGIPLTDSIYTTLWNKGLFSTADVLEICRIPHKGFIIHKDMYFTKKEMSKNG